MFQPLSFFTTDVIKRIDEDFGFQSCTTRKVSRPGCLRISSVHPFSVYHENMLADIDAFTYTV